MLNVTAIEAWDIFYICATKFNDNSQGTVIALGIIYSIVGIISAILNVYLLYLVATRRKLRKPSNLVMFPLLWNNIVLILGIIPMTLLELIVTKLQTSKHYISVRYYLSKTYITLCFYSVVTIALFRMRKIKNGAFHKNDDYLWKQVLCKVIGVVLSSSLPYITALFSIKYGTKGIFATSTVSMVIVVLIMVLSYGIILSIVRKSKQNLGNQIHNKNDSKNKRTLRKLKQNINLVMGSFSFLLIPCFANAMFFGYAVNNETFFKNNMDLINTFQLICFTIILLNGISNPLVYFYTQTEIKQEVKSLECRKSINFYNHIKTRLDYIRSPTSRSVKSSNLESVSN